MEARLSEEELRRTLFVLHTQIDKWWGILH